MQTVYDFNNEGVVLGGHGETSNAILKFKQGLIAMRNLPEQLHEDATFSLDAVPVATSKSTKSDFVYNYVFAIVGSLQPGGGARDAALCSAVLMYNVAISLQLLENDGSGRRAFQCYRGCLLAVEHLMVSPDSACVAARLTVACFHNMAEIFFDNDDLPKAASLATLAQELLSAQAVADGRQALFDDETTLLFAFSCYFLPFSASLPRGAAAA